MNKKLKKEYVNFQKKYSNNYTKENKGILKKQLPKINNMIFPENMFNGFLCYKALYESKDYIFKLTPFHSIPEPHADNYKGHLKNQGLDINISRNMLTIFAKTNIENIPEYLQKKGIQSRDDYGYRIDDIFESEKEIVKIQNSKKENYNNAANLIKIIGDPCQIHLTPNNFLKTDLKEFHTKIIKDSISKDTKIINITNKLMLMDNDSSELIKFYNWLNKTSKEKPHFSTNYICWDKLPRGVLEMNPEMIIEKEPIFSAEYFPKNKVLKINQKKDSITIAIKKELKKATKRIKIIMKKD